MIKLVVILLIRVLCIGNSFSWDAVEQELVPMCNEAGVEVEIHNLYYGGCSLEQHAQFLLKDTAAYSHRVCTNKEGRVIKDTITLRNALREGKYDYISLQQASHFSGMYDTYAPWLRMLIDTVRVYQFEAQLCWLQTWAYSKDAKHPAYPNYGNNQQLMYDSIVACTKNLLRDYPAELLIIPCGSAVQLGRRTKLGDSFCRDGYHLNYSYGRYTASAVWFEILTKRDVRRLRYKPETMSRCERKVCQKVAHKAVRNAENAVF